MGTGLQDAQVIVGIITTAILALSGLITGVWSLVSKNRVNKADALDKKIEASQSLVSTAQSLIEPLQARIVQLETDNKLLRAQQIKLECNVRELRERVREFEIGTQRLVFQIKALGKEPVWNPEDKEEE